MAATESGDLLFDPKVWSDHVQAYFDKKLVYGAFAVMDRTLEAEGTGLTVNFPFYGKIGAAEEPLETASLTVDNLSDDSFNATVFEVGKAIGFKKKSFKKSADSVSGMISEGQRQMARVHAEKVDEKLITEIHAGANNTDVSAGPVDVKLTLPLLNKARISAVGDKMNDAQVCMMHSKQYLDIVNDSGTGLLKADANDPAMWVEGFMGRFLGMAIVVTDQVPSSGAGPTTEYSCSFHKNGAYGIMEKQMLEFDEDKDILAREKIYTSNQWYAVKSFHAKVAADDLRSAVIKTNATADA